LIDFSPLSSQLSIVTVITTLVSLLNMSRTQVTTHQQSAATSAPSAMESLSNSEKLLIRSAATFVEIIGGQPLDRIKVNMQLPKADRIPFRTLLQGGIGSFYAASATSVIQRCFFYIPAIYFGADLWKHYFTIENSPVLNGFAASFFTSAIVTPGVSCFENLKLQQQVNMKENSSLRKTFFKTYHSYGLKGLFPSLASTYSREAAFALGVCYLSPTIHQYIKDKYEIDSVLGAGCASGVITQILTQPFDTIKTWQEKTHMSFRSSLRTMIEENGVRFLFNGSLPRVCRGMWTFSCLFYCTNEFSSMFKDTFHSSSDDRSGSDSISRTSISSRAITEGLDDANISIGNMKTDSSAAVSVTGDPSSNPPPRPIR
jgi:hypothetical protein